MRWVHTWWLAAEVTAVVLQVLLRFLQPSVLLPTSKGSTRMICDYSKQTFLSLNSCKCAVRSVLRSILQSSWRSSRSQNWHPLDPTDRFLHRIRLRKFDGQLWALLEGRVLSWGTFSCRFFRSRCKSKIMFQSSVELLRFFFKSNIPIRYAPFLKH